MSQPICQEILFNAPPARVYSALTDEAQFSKLCGGAPTTIDAEPGGSFSCFGGMIHGRNVECVPGRRLVQAWRVKNWDEGVYSLVSFDLRAEGNATRVVLKHLGYPEGQGEHLDQGWHANYWEPLRKFLE